MSKDNIPVIGIIKITNKINNKSVIVTNHDIYRYIKNKQSGLRSHNINFCKAMSEDMKDIEINEDIICFDILKTFKGSYIDDTILLMYKTYYILKYNIEDNVYNANDIINEEYFKCNSTPEGLYYSKIYNTIMQNGEVTEEDLYKINKEVQEEFDTYRQTVLLPLLINNIKKIYEVNIHFLNCNPRLIDVSRIFRFDGWGLYTLLVDDGVDIDEDKFRKCKYKLTIEQLEDMFRYIIKNNYIGLFNKEMFGELTYIQKYNKSDYRRF